MSEREKAVRELAEEIASSQYNRKSMQAKAWRTVAARWERRLTAFLAEREDRQKGELRAAAGDVVEIFLDARPPGTVDLVYDKLARRLGLEDPDGS